MPCHGPLPGSTSGAYDYFNDIERMVEEGLIIPLDSERSRIIQVMRDGSMPPPGVEPRPTDEDIGLVAAFIDQPLFWPAPSTEQPPEDAPDASAQPLPPLPSVPPAPPLPDAGPLVELAGEAGEAQPGEAQPSEAQPGEAQPGEAQPGEAQPGEAQGAPPDAGAP